MALLSSFKEEKQEVNWENNSTAICEVKHLLLPFRQVTR